MKQRWKQTLLQETFTVQAFLLLLLLLLLVSAAVACLHSEVTTRFDCSPTTGGDYGDASRRESDVGTVLGDQTDPHPPTRLLAPKAQGVSCLRTGVLHHPVFNNSIYLKQDDLRN